MASYAARFAAPEVLGGPCAEAVPLAGTTVDLRRLGKGVGWGLGIEGFAAVSFYAVWRLLHLLIG